MKRILTVLVLNCMFIGLFAQHMPIGINYQAVARDKAGNELKNKNLNVRISVLRNDATGIVEYAEMHSVTTDPFGLFNLVIGQGSWYAGEKNEFLLIDWGSSPHFLKIEVDFGQGFISMGTMQFLAVPYALYAASAGDTQGEEDLDKDPENELQILSLDGLTLSIKQGARVINSVTLSDVVNDADSDPTNEIQDLNIDQNHNLRITNNSQASVIDLKPFLDNTDNQQLSKTSNSISISDGNTIILDADSTNELQELMFDPQKGELSLTKNGGTVEIFDKDSSATNELQDLSLNGYDLSLSKSSQTVNIRPEVIAFRAKKGMSANNIPANESEVIEYDEIVLNIGNAFNISNGTFTVPAGGEGLYSFTITYDYYLSNHQLIIYKNNLEKDIVFNGYIATQPSIRTYEYLDYLLDNDTIHIELKMNGTPSSQCGSAVFSGYRIH